MPELRPETPRSALSLNDIFFAVFKHKRKILLSALAGFIAAAIVYLLYPPLYESQAKLLVRYVLERSAVDPIESAGGSGKTTDNVLGSEVEILTSWDLAAQVAETIGVQRLAPGSEAKASKEAAAYRIISGLDVN